MAVFGKGKFYSPLVLQEGACYSIIMATMFPSRLPDEPDISYAERVLFSAFKNQLDNSYHVYHSFHWTENSGTPREIDFIVFNPAIGFAVLEVKGGEILLEDGQWFTKNRDGRFHISNPFRQVQNNMYFLLDYYRERYGKGFNGRAAWGVCFPDTAYLPDKSHPEMSRTNILFDKHINSLEAWLADLFDKPFYGEGSSGLTGKAAADFADILKPRLRIRLSIRAAIREQQRDLARINFFQEHLLDLFEDKNRVAFQGSAGTGKTWIAVKKTLRLATAGKNCLLLCYNSLLAKQLKNVTTIQNPSDGGVPELIDIHTFHSFANRIFVEYIDSIIKEDVTAAGLFQQLILEVYPDCRAETAKGFIGFLSNPERREPNRHALGLFRKKGLDVRILDLLENLLAESGESYFGFNVPVALLSLLEDASFEAEKYDAILIDEGQDFAGTWCDCIAYFLKNKRKRIVYIFYDDNQNIFMKKRILPIIDLISKYNVSPFLYQLRKNIRNTKSIYEYATAKTNLGKTSRAVDVEGTPPVEVTVKSIQAARKQTGKIITTLINEHNIRNSQITVLTDVSVHKSAFADEKGAGNFQLTETGKGSAGKYIKVRSISRFKGLESDIIILVTHAREIENENRNELLYTGMTRAKFMLYMVEIQ